MISFYFVCIFFSSYYRKGIYEERSSAFSCVYFISSFYILGYIFRNYIIWNLLLRCIRYFNLIFIYYLLSHTYLYNYRGIVSYSSFVFIAVNIRKTLLCSLNLYCSETFFRFNKIVRSLFVVLSAYPVENPFTCIPRYVFVCRDFAWKRRRCKLLTDIVHSPYSSLREEEAHKEALQLTFAKIVEFLPAPVKMTRSKIELGDVTPHNIKQLKLLNQVVFPVSYNEKFYKDVLEAGELAKLAYYNDIVVGAVCCRVDTSENSRRLYIMTLGCLYPYRRLGIGTVMVQHVLNYVNKDGNFDSIFLHVQISNEGAIDFYKKFGFEIVETKEHYYKRIEPADAHVLQKTLRPRANHQTVN